MQYQSQKVAYPYFALALLLFVLQVLLGLWLAINYFATLSTDQRVEFSSQPFCMEPRFPSNSTMAQQVLGRLLNLKPFISSPLRPIPLRPPDLK